MKKITSLIVALTLFATCVSAQLPAGMEKLLPDNVVVTSTSGGLSCYNKSTNSKRVVAVGTKVFFTAKDNAHGEELWLSDGTVAGTRMVKDINPGAEASNPSWLCVLGNLCFFAATTPAAGAELWVSDGTEAGTKMVMDIYPGATSSAPIQLTAFGNKLLFFAMDEESEAMPKMDLTVPEKWLWISDGTAAGTQLIGKTPLVGNGDSHHGLIVVTWDGKKAFFNAYEEISKYTTLWVTDGTAAGTVALPTNPDGNGNVQWLTAIGNKVIFRATTTKTITLAVDPANASLGVDGDIGDEIWTSDGTAAGTKWIGIDFAKGQANGTPVGTQFAWTLPLNDHLLLFRASDGPHGVEPCILDLNKPFKDGTQLATPAVADLNPKMIFDINSWSGNGGLTTADSWPQTWRCAYNGIVYFPANGLYYNEEFKNEDGTLKAITSNYSLWKIDVSSGDINQINSCEFIYNWTNPPMVLKADNKGSDEGNGFIEVNGKLWWGAWASTGNFELWTMPDNNTNPAIYYDFPGNGNPSNLIAIGNTLFFTAGDLREGDQWPSLYRITVSGTGIPSIRASRQLNIFPNPATDIVNISGQGIQTVVLTDIQGRKVLEQKGDKQQINVSSLKGGFYLLNIKLENGSTVVQKLIVK